MAVQTCAVAQHATLSSTTADSVTFLGAGSSVAVTNRDSSNTLYVRTKPTNEVQTITLSSWDATDTIKFTHGGTESAAVTYSADVSNDIRQALESLASIGKGNVWVTRTSTTVYVVYFKGRLAHTDVSAITCTNGTGSATGSVAETVKGGSMVAVSAADDTYVVMPQQTKVLTPYRTGRSSSISVVGDGNAYSVEIL